MTAFGGLGVLVCSFYIFLAFYCSNFSFLARLSVNNAIHHKQHKEFYVTRDRKKIESGSFV